MEFSKNYSLRSPRIPAWSAFAFVALGLTMTSMVGACADSPRRPNGDSCGADGQCASGFCYVTECLDPEGDADLDGLTNRQEFALGTNAHAVDTDGDGRSDRLEVGESLGAPADFDGDGVFDALESNIVDSDRDCLVDERDPANMMPDAAAVLAEYACCCDGLCSKSGWTTTATCTGETLVCERPQPDRDADGVPDVCDDPHIDLAPELRAAACADLCVDIAERCDQARPDCVAECAALSRDEGLWIANYVCLSSSCDEGACFGEGGTFPEPEKCAAACRGIIDCGLGPRFEVGDALMCRLNCAGSFAADGTSATSIECLATLDGLTPCNVADAAGCFEEGGLCRSACERLEPLHDQACPSTAPVFERYSNQSACEASCGELPGREQLRFVGCQVGSACATPEFDCAALGPLPTADSHCETVCGAITTACSPAGWQDEPLCVEVCEGFRPHVPWTDAALSANCLKDLLGQCDGGLDDIFGPLLQCMAQTSPACETYCAKMTECVGQSDPNCPAFCTLIQIEQPGRIQTVSECLGARSACDGYLDCLSIQPSAICVPSCASQLACDPESFPSSDACVQACAAGLGTPGDGFAHEVCETLNDSCDLACGALLEGGGPSPACEAACRGSGACDAYAYGLCAETCRAFEAVSSEPIDHACLVTQLGPECDVAQVRAMCGL